MIADVGLAAHRLAVAHLEACFEAQDADAERAARVGSPASAPFDGCLDCIVREVLYVMAGVLCECGHLFDMHSDRAVVACMPTAYDKPRRCLCMGFRALAGQPPDRTDQEAEGGEEDDDND